METCQNLCRLSIMIAAAVLFLKYVLNSQGEAWSCDKVHAVF